ncbi:hypothetical protein [Sphingomonas sp. MS122]|uniref:hypothetical protein n=1 Tax=Sphingomonas sp. MS122 TaxID=3412683 RepID=UPI003C2E2CFF
MSSDFSNAGRVRFEGSGGGSFLTYDDVEARLVEAVRFHWRTESGGWPFASDGPWHLIRKEMFVDHDAGREAARMPRVPLGKGEMARMREAFGWLLLVPDDYDRRLIVEGVKLLAKGHKRVPWARLSKRGMGDAAPDALRMAYRRAMGALTQRVNAKRAG